MRFWPLLVALALVCAPALASSSGTKGDTDKVVELHADLRGPDGTGGSVHYLEQGSRVRIKVDVFGLRATSASIVLDGQPFPLVMDPLSGRGYLYLDSRRQRIVRLRPGDEADVTTNGLVMMRGILESVR